MSNEESLILEFQGGSRQAFQMLFELYRAPLYGFFYRRLGDRERAEDLTQDTFIAVIRAVERYQPLASVRTYFYSIATNILFYERRRQARQKAGTSDDSEAAEPLQTHDPDDVLWVRAALERLDPLEREILMLREFEQLSYAEIAEVLGLPVNTVRSRLFRARDALKSQLQPTDRHRVGREASEMEHI
jgi:RNA polymerase sigma-70 factor, ECF subfamily